MKGIIVNYRRGRHTQNPRQMIIKIEGIDEISNPFTAKIPARVSVSTRFFTHPIEIKQTFSIPP